MAHTQAETQPAGLTKNGMVRGIENDIVNGVKDVHYGHARAVCIALTDMRIHITRKHIVCNGNAYDHDYTYDCDVGHYKDELVVYLYDAYNQQATLFIPREKIEAVWREA